MKSAPFKEVKIKGTWLKMVQGDLVVQDVEAIVNAANPAIEGGGGVDGRIHHIAGPELLQACQAYKEKHQIKQIEVADAVLTDSYGIKKISPTIKYVIHTVGPDCRIASQWDEREHLLEGAYVNSLDLAKDKGISSIAFPAISTGAYNYPFWEAQAVAVRVVKSYIENQTKPTFKEIRLVYFSDEEMENALRVWEELF